MEHDIDDIALCPFCGSDDLTINFEKANTFHNENFWVSCNLCYTEGQAFSTEEEAVKFWNHRPGENYYKRALKAIVDCKKADVADYIKRVDSIAINALAAGDALISGVEE